MRDVVEVALFTDDVEAVKRFYRSVLGSEPDAEWTGGAIFTAGTSKLLIHEQAGTVEGGPPNEDHFALAAADLDRACDELRGRGLKLLVEARDYSWGRSAYLRDPDGRLVELSQAVAAPPVT
jgi:catechol 2,3-dioxygenase-like lactoylglutathione lyase family enzyme